MAGSQNSLTRGGGDLSPTMEVGVMIVDIYSSVKDDIKTKMFWCVKYFIVFNSLLCLIV